MTIHACALVLILGMCMMYASTVALDVTRPLYSSPDETEHAGSPTAHTVAFIVLLVSSFVTVAAALTLAVLLRS